MVQQWYKNSQKWRKGEIISALFLFSPFLFICIYFYRASIFQIYLADVNDRKTVKFLQNRTTHGQNVYIQIWGGNPSPVLLHCYMMFHSMRGDDWWRMWTIKWVATNYAGTELTQNFTSESTNVIILLCFCASFFNLHTHTQKYENRN